MSKRSNMSKVTTKLDEEKENNKNIKDGNGKFWFKNGDCYEGEYRILKGENIFKQGHGVYITDNFDIYSAQWDRDKITTELHIQYNNGMQYKGEINNEGEMTGFGIYIFQDQSSVVGNWIKNKLEKEANFVEPSGFEWNGRQSESGTNILFEPGNHFWKELYGISNEKDEIILNNEIENQPPSKLSLKNKRRTTGRKSQQ